MHIKDIVFHPKMPFAAKDFDTQEGIRYTLEGPLGLLIETAAYLHWKDKIPLDIAIDLSCMSGCTRKCLFCAAANSNSIMLTPEQIVEQADIAIQQAKRLEPVFTEEVIKKRKITFSFEGMGEPCDMAELIAESIHLISKKYQKDGVSVQFIVSSILDRPAALEEWVPPNVNLQSLQFSLHATTDEKRKRLMGGTARTPIEDIFSALDKFHKDSPETQIKVNYVLIEGENDGEDDIKELCRLVNGRPFFVKISYLNNTDPAEKSSLNASKKDKLENFYYEIKKNHSKTYRYGSFKQIEISCGQLASYAAGSEIDWQTHEQIKRLYKCIQQERCTLFLGAGASYTAWDQYGLAKQLYNELSFSHSFEDSKLSLAEIADIYEHRGERKKVDLFVNEALKASAIPLPMRTMTRYPWNAIYTTNYDEFVEQSYSESVRLGFANKTCFPITSISDFQQLPNNSIPFIKLHGTISKGSRSFISETDYLDGYINHVDIMLKQFEIDRLKGGALFIGYSFRDSYIQQELFNLWKKRDIPQGQVWAVQPAREMSIDDSNRLKEKFGITLLPLTFQSLMNQLEIFRRKPVLLASGSSKRTIESVVPAKRKGEVGKIDRLCVLVAKGLQYRDVNIITGSTTTEKIGYMIGSRLEKKAVTTYLWHGAEHIAGNQIDKMINTVRVGNRPVDVVDRMLVECNMVLLIGGGGLSLREAYTAISNNLPIIPVAIGGAYASDVVHDFFRIQHYQVSLLAGDKGIDANVFNFSAKILTKNRLERLNLSTNNEEVVADTVLEIIDNLRILLGQVFQ